MKRMLLVLVLAAVSWGFGAAHGADVTFESLLTEMVALDQLAEFPAPPFTCSQFSSYDRRSTDPSDPSDENWFANHDRGQHIRQETRNGRDEWVLMDAAGPGAVVRIWSANANDAGVLRVYLDGAEEPVIAMPLRDMLDGLHPPFLEPIAGIRARGWNLYFPIPYAKHCKITADKPDFYYHVNYRTYPEGTTVETYAADTAQRHAAAIERVRARLAEPAAFTPPASRQSDSYNETIAPGGSVEMSIDGPGAVYRITCAVGAADLEAALRACVLEIAFDGQASPSVQAPLGDFFGTAPGANPYASLCSGVLASGRMYSHWVMPFQRSARLRVVNRGAQSVTIDGEVVSAPRSWTPGSMYFHAKWRSEHPIPTRPRQDWTYIEFAGAGRYVGNMLHVTNPVKDWWGEGDEKIYVDGEAFPSHFGTGTEDYYGYAWCDNTPFTHAYHNQPRVDGPGNYGQTCVSRFHIIDSIPFTTSFKFDMEVWHWAECEIAMAATSYWYARPGGTDTFAPPAAEALVVIPPPPPPEPMRVAGALEGEQMRVIRATGGAPGRQPSAGWPWSGEEQLWWIDAVPGDTLELAFNVESAGRYEVFGRFTKAIDYGIARLYVNDVPAGEPRDFFNNGVIVTPEESLGVFDLKAGENVLKVEITGANERSRPKRHMFGLDYLLLKAAE